jgi:hypothetical protein
MPGLDNWIKIENGSCSFDFSDLKIWKKEECIDYAVEKMVEKSENLYLALSGGLDSEFAANCLFDRGVKFTPVIMDIYTNRIENWYAHRWCYENKVEPLVITMSEEEVVKTFPKISQERNIPFYCSIPIILSKMVSQREGNLILGGEEIIDRDYFLSGEFTKMSKKINFCEYAFCVEQENSKHIGGFLSYTPELFLNCLEEIDYNKPGQIALAEYYGVLPRPKINANINLSLLPGLKHLKNILDKDKIVNVYEMESKDSFIDQAKRLKKITIQARELMLAD